MSKKKNTQRKRQAAEQRKPFAFKDSYDLVIVGGGASGLACAVSCLQEARKAERALPSILLVEQGKRIGTPILRSGNGRCNFSNSQLDVSRYWNSVFVSQTLGFLDGSPVRSITNWFEELGLVWAEAPESGGLLYPFSNKASSVLEVLTAALPSHAVDIHPCVKALETHRSHDGFDVLLEESHPAAGNGRAAANESKGTLRQAMVHAGRVVVAAGGGCADPLLASAIIAPPTAPWRPTLGPLAAAFPENVSGEELDGIRSHVRISLPNSGFSEEGEVLFRNYGISGIVVFNASRYADSGETLLVDFLPAMETHEAEAAIRMRVERLQGQPAITLFRGFVLPELGAALLMTSGIQPDEPLQQELCCRISRTMKAFPLTVQGVADEAQCQVHRGGIAPESVRAESLELKAQPGLYVLGEALNVDGPCGGYNLHWAWTCGILAGKDISRKIKKEQSC